MHDTHDTIAAIASPAAGAMRGIVRLSGPEALSAVAPWLDGCDARRLSRACAVAATVLLPPPWGPIDCQAYVWPNQRSYTRQPAVELHTFGCLPLLEAILDCLLQSGARLAEPGEFTLRAFLAGRLDLTEAEAVLGVIDAQGQSELDAALRQLAGGLRRPLDRLRDELLELLAEVEAGLDFVEEDIEFISAERLVERLASVRVATAEVTAQLEARGHARGTRRLVLRGWPNVGKSSLLNALAGAPAAIVADAPGTTRDYLVWALELDGLPIELVDTAGIEPLADDDPVRRQAQQLGSDQQRSAHLELLCLDAGRPLNDWERAQLDPAATDQHRLVVLTKSDLPRRAELPGNPLATSARSGAGLADLRAEVLERLRGPVAGESAALVTTASRCRDALRSASEALERAEQLAGRGGADELVAAELREALDALGQVVGAVFTDELLDRIFSRFCIGK